MWFFCAYNEWMTASLFTEENTKAIGKLRIFYLPQHSFYGGFVLVQA